jgi:hypothetical protein
MRIKLSTSIKKNNQEIKNPLVLCNQNSMARKKPRDPITEYRKRNLKAQIRQSRKVPASANNNQNLAKAIVIVFIVVILILVYMLGFFSG